MFIILILAAGSIAVSWISEINNKPICLIISILLYLSFFYFNRKKINKSNIFAFIFLLAILAFITISLYKSEHIAAMLILSSLFWVTKVEYFIDKLKSFHLNKIKSLFHYPKGGLIYFIELSKRLQQNKKYKKNFIFIQSFIISIGFFIFILFPHIHQLFPPELSSEISKANEFVNSNKENLTFYAYIAYIAFSLMILFNSTIKQFSYNRQNRIFLNIQYFFFDITVFFITVNLTMLLTIVIGALIYLLYRMIGLDLAIILGFFVFPIWVSQLLSYLIIGITFIFPEKLKLEDIN